jgi:hypothetical protein
MKATTPLKSNPLRVGSSRGAAALPSNETHHDGAP